jgi:hypothetical protein
MKTTMTKIRVEQASSLFMRFHQATNGARNRASWEPSPRDAVLRNLTLLLVMGLLTLPAPAATLPASISGVTSQGFKINK